MPVRRIKRISQLKDKQAGWAIAGKMRLFTELLTCCFLQQQFG
jgi:hypothetical protein